MVDLIFTQTCSLKVVGIHEEFWVIQSARIVENKQKWLLGVTQLTKFKKYSRHENPHMQVTTKSSMSSCPVLSLHSSLRVVHWSAALYYSIRSSRK